MSGTIKQLEKEVNSLKNEGAKKVRVVASNSNSKMIVHISELNLVETNTYAPALLKSGKLSASTLQTYNEVLQYNSNVVFNCEKVG